MQTYGFHFRYYRSNGSKIPVTKKYLFKDTETLTKGDFLNLEVTGTVAEVDLFATGGDTGLIGVANQTLAGTDSTTWIEVILDNSGDAVWAVTDANARAETTELDVSGTTGAQTVATDGDSDIIVMSNSTATEPTLVRSHPRAYGLGIT